MRTPSVGDHYYSAQELIRREINELTPEQLEGTSVEEWAKYFMSKYALRPITFIDTPPILEQRVDRVERRGDFGEPWRDERVVALVGLPIESNENITGLLRMQGQTWSLNPPRWEYRDGCIFVEAETSPEAAKRTVDKARTHVGFLNQSIEAGNKQLPLFVQERIMRRMQTVGARAQTFQTLAEALGAELTTTPRAERRLTEAPRVTESIAKLRRPQPAQKAIPRLKPEEFQPILDVIEGQGATFERTPQTAAKLDEEDIRNLVLSSLNAVFSLGAVGEAFSKQGKTDIYLVVPEGGIFIAECKIWRGAHMIGEAVGQILSYLTWREAYGVVLLFSRNKGFSGVLGAIRAAIKDIGSLRGELHRVDDHHWFARHTLPGDGSETVEIHYIVYNIWAEP
jgi:hypothetical protein